MDALIAVLIMALAGLNFNISAHHSSAGAYAT
jgi:hypothetical protein